MEVQRAIEETKREFPFGRGYMDGKDEGYQTVINLIEKYSKENSLNVLSIGSGPCDYEAILSKMGHKVTAVDDLDDGWHVIGKNRERIKTFAEEQGIDFYQARIGSEELMIQEEFDAVCILDVIEHLENPRGLLNVAGEYLKPNALLMILTPNAAHLANRLKLLMGKPVSKEAEYIFWNVGPYRSHIKEYTVDELKTIIDLSGFDLVTTKTINHLVNVVESGMDSSLKTSAVEAYKLVAGLRPTLRDTQITVARKPIEWSPTPPSIEEFSKRYDHIEKYNLDGVNSKEIMNQLVEQ